MMKKKICMLGAFAVGKTSLVTRFIENAYSDKYQTTVGVNVKKTERPIKGQATTLMVWDLLGEDEANKVLPTYFRGADGIILVADGTRQSTLPTAIALRDRIFTAVGEIPYLLAVNKADLIAEWEIDQPSLDAIASTGVTVIKTSAKTGDLVEQAFIQLAEKIIG